MFLYSLQHASALRSCPCAAEPSGDAKCRDDKIPMMMVASDLTIRYSRNPIPYKLNTGISASRMIA
jgi:hypothetical protein